MFNAIANIKRNGYTPDTIIDIGAHHGLWTRECLKIYNAAQYYLFEAIPYQELDQYINSLNTPKVKAINAVLNDTNCEVDWYEMRNTGDSMFKELNKPFANCNPVKRQTNTLNNINQICNLCKDSKNILIKIDCQGAEIPILKGATDILGKTDFIILEIPLFGQYNTGVPTFLEHIQFMDSIGFIPYDMAENHYIGKFTMQIDMVFINKQHPFNQAVQDQLR